MSSVKQLLEVLGADSEITALRKSMEQSLHRLQAPLNDVLSWPDLMREKLKTSMKLSVVGCAGSSEHVYRLVLEDDLTRVGIDVKTSLRLPKGSDADPIMSEVNTLTRYFKISKDRVLFNSPMPPDYRRVVGNQNVFSLLCFVPIERQLEEVVAKGYKNGESEFLNDCRTHYRLLDRYCAAIGGRYGKFYLGVVVDDLSSDVVKVLSFEFFLTDLLAELTILDYLKREKQMEETQGNEPNAQLSQVNNLN